MRTVFLLSLVCFGLSSAQISGGLSLSEAIEMAKLNNRDIQNSRHDLEIAKQKIKEITSKGFPQVDFQSRYHYNVSRPTRLVPSNFVGYGKRVGHIPVQFGLKQDASMGIQIDQLVFDPSYIVGLITSKVYKSTGAMGLFKTELEVKKVVTESYVNVLVAEEAFIIYTENLKLAQQMLDETEAFYKQGFREEESLEQGRINFSNTRNAYNRADRSRRIAKKVLNFIIGIDLESVVELTDKVVDIVSSPLFASEEGAISFDATKNIDYILAKATLKIDKLAWKLERLKRLPSIKVFFNGAYTGFSDSFTFLNSSQKWYSVGLVGVDINMPILSSFKRHYKIKQAKIEVLKSENKLKSTQERLILEYQTALSDYTFALESYKTSKANFILADRIYRKNIVKYREGVTGSLELQQAQGQLYREQSSYLQSVRYVVEKRTELDNLTTQTNL